MFFRRPFAYWRTCTKYNGIVEKHKTSCTELLLPQHHGPSHHPQYCACGIQTTHVCNSDWLQLHNQRVTESSKQRYTEELQRIKAAPHLSGSAPKPLDILQAPVQGLPGVCIARGVVCDHK